MTKTEFNKKRLLKIIVFTFLFAIVGIILAFIAKSGITIPCIFYKLTGISCPGCGTTRAVISMLNLDFVKAFKFNPLLPAQILYFGWIYVVCARNYIKGKRFSYKGTPLAIDIIAIIVILIGAVIRNII